MKKLLSLVIALVLLISACGGNSKVETQSQEPVKTRETIEIDIPEVDNSITLLLANSTINEGNDVLMGAYMTELMKEAGFDVEVLFYKIDYRNRQESLDEALELMRELIQSGKNLIIESRYSLNELDAENLLYYPEDNSDSPYIIIGERKNYTYTGVYIEKTLEAKYGKSIESTYEYGEFLKWVSENHPDKIPGLFVMNGGYGETFSPIALFAQESGYIRADKAMGSITEDGTTLYMDLGAIQTADEFTPIVEQAVNLPFFIDMDSALSDWSSKGYIKFKMFEEPVKFENYASLVLNVSDTTEYYSYDNQSSHWQLKDVSDFNLHIFTKDGTFPDTPKVTDYGYSGKFGISGESSSPETAAGFLDWIYNSTDNYLLFMCGKEGMDYRISDGELEFLVNSKNIKYGEWYKHISFVVPEMDVVMPHFPANWKDVKALLSDVEGTSVLRVIGYDNIEVDVSKLVEETVFDDTLRGAYNSDVLPKYNKYFDAFSKEVNDYSADDLRNGIDKSPNATLKKKAYEDLLNGICGN